MQLKIQSCLTEPHSEISCFRDITLYAKTYIFDDILLVCPLGTRAIYWNWLKSHGAHDFISDLIREDEKEDGYGIGTKKGYNIITDRIDCNNLNEIIRLLDFVRGFD